jgi:hypothetical protein
MLFWLKKRKSKFYNIKFKFVKNLIISKFFLNTQIPQNLLKILQDSPKLLKNPKNPQKIKTQTKNVCFAKNALKFLSKRFSLFFFLQIPESSSFLSRRFSSTLSGLQFDAVKFVCFDVMTWRIFLDHFRHSFVAGKRCSMEIHNKMFALCEAV